MTAAGGTPGPVRVQLLGTGDAFGSGGRLHTCFYLAASTARFLIDCGASALISMRRFGVDPNDIDTVFLTHLHGDHFAGLPFLILDYMWESRRKTTLTIAGPRRLEQRTWTLFENMFPRFPEERVTRKLKFVVLEANDTKGFNGVEVSTIRTPHTKPDISLAFRVSVGGKTVVFTGDTGWTEEIVPFCAGADLFICECTYFDSADLDFHLNYPLIAKNRSRFNVGRMILSHVGREVHEHRSEVDIELASDGMQIEL